MPEKIAVERNLEVVPRSTLGEVMVDDGDELEIVHFVGGGDMHRPVDDDSWSVAGKTFRSRLIVGTGKYKDFEQNAAAVAASGAEIVTVAVRRVNVSDPNAPMLTDYIDPEEDHLSAQHRGLLQGRSRRSARCGWRARRAAGNW